MDKNIDSAQAAAAVSARGQSRSGLRSVLLITGREFKNQIAQRSYRVCTIILLLIVVIASFMPTVIKLVQSGGAERTRAKVVVVNSAGAVGGMAEGAVLEWIGDMLNSEGERSAYELRGGNGEAVESLYEKVDGGEIDVLFFIARWQDGALAMTYSTAASPMSDSNLHRVRTVADALGFLDDAERMQLSEAQIQALQTPADISVEYRLSGAKPANELAAGYIFALGGGMLMYIAILLYGNSVATGVVVEKSSRVMELLVKTASPVHLLAGKIAGIGAACLLQMACLAVIGIASLALQTSLQASLFGAEADGFAQFLAGASVPFYIFFLLYFLLYFFMYASLYAGLGAMVRRQDELQTVILVPTFMIVMGFMAIYLGVYQPDARWVKVLSYIPLFTPMLMMVRIALSEVIWWEYIVTAALMLAAIYAGMVLSARLYRRGVLMYGQKPGFSQMIRMMKKP